MIMVTGLLNLVAASERIACRMLHMRVFWCLADFRFIPTCHV